MQFTLESIVLSAKERLREKRELPFMVLVKNAYQFYSFELSLSNDKEKALTFELLKLMLSYTNASEYVIVTEGWASQTVGKKGRLKLEGRKEVVLITRVKRAAGGETSNSGHLFDIVRDEEGRFLDLVAQEDLQCGVGTLTGLFMPKDFALSAEQRTAAEIFIREAAEMITLQ